MSIPKGSTNVFPQIDARFQRFSNFKEESSTFATLVYGHAGKAKVLKYDVATLVKRGAFLTALSAKGTIFTMDAAVWYALVMYFAVSAGSFCLAYFTADKSDFDYTKLESVSNYLNMFIPFILGLYVSLVLARWWTLRTDGIGKVLDSAQNLILICVAVLPGQEFHEWHDQVLKYALASVSLVVQTVRNKGNIDMLAAEGLLTSEEVTLLADTPIRPRPVVMWAWICAVCTKVFEEQGIAPGKARDVVAECVKARDGISLIWTYLGTQLPFAYVHLVTFLVNLNNLVMSIKCGVVAAASVRNENWIHAGSQLVFLGVVPLLYQGLLSVSYIIHDPFGEDMLDFPVMAFQEYMNEAACTFSHFTNKCPALSVEYGPPPSKRALSLRKGAGRAVADKEAAQEYAKESVGEAGAQDAVEDTDGEVTESPLIASLREQARVKDELIKSLTQQNKLLESNVAVVQSRLRSLEAQMTRLPPAPGQASRWCAAPMTGYETDTVSVIRS
jgi:hypothetical protein